LQVRVLPLADHHPLSRFGHNRFALLFLAAGPGSRHPDELRHLFGATQRETELIELLLRGLTPAECAEQRQISINTIRTQLASLLAKTGTRFQAELVSVVMSLPALRM
jgi:DNA-binding CsgD family transcriptional regulator